MSVRQEVAGAKPLGWGSPTVVCLLCAAAGAAVYGSAAVACDFTFDDHLAVRDNADARWDAPLDVLWKHDFWGKDLREMDSHKSWRPLTMLSFRFDHWRQSPDFRAAPFHETNVVLHAIASAAVAATAYKLRGSQGNGHVAPGAAGLLFAVHAVHTEAVVGVVGRAEILCAIFGLTAFHVYLIGDAHIVAALFRRDVVHNSVAPEGGTAALPRFVSRLLWALAFVALYAAAVLSKEIGVAVAVICGCYEVAVLLWGADETARQGGGWGQLRCRLPRFVGRAFFLLCLFFGYIMIRFVIMTPAKLEVDGLRSSLSRFADWIETAYSSSTLDSSQLIRRTENPFKFLVGLSRVLSLNYLQVRYALLLLWPAELSAEWSYNCLPAVESLSDVRNIASLGLDAALVVAVIVMFAHRDSRILVCFAWMVVPYLPGSNLFVTVGTLVAERILYLPSIGYCFLVGFVLAAAVQPLLHRDCEAPLSDQGDAQPEAAADGASTPAAKRSAHPGARRRAVAVFSSAAFVALISFMCSRTLRRVPEWASDRTLFESAVATCPTSAKMNQQLGQVRLADGDTDEAFRLFTRAREIDPEFCDIDFNLGMYYTAVNDAGGATRHLTAALDCPYAALKAWPNLQAVWELLAARGPNATLWAERAAVLLAIEDHNTAVTYYREAGVVALQEGRHAAARKYFRQALRVLPYRCDLRYWLVQAQLADGRTKSALKDGWRAVRCGLHEHALGSDGLTTDGRRLGHDAFKGAETLGSEAKQLVEEARRQQASGGNSALVSPESSSRDSPSHAGVATGRTVVELIQASNAALPQGSPQELAQVARGLEQLSGALLAMSQLWARGANLARVLDTNDGADAAAAEVDGADEYAAFAAVNLRTAGHAFIGAGDFVNASRVFALSEQVSATDAQTDCSYRLAFARALLHRTVEAGSAGDEGTPVASSTAALRAKSAAAGWEDPVLGDPMAVAELLAVEEDPLQGSGAEALVDRAVALLVRALDCSATSAAAHADLTQMGMAHRVQEWKARSAGLG